MSNAHWIAVIVLALVQAATRTYIVMRRKQEKAAAEVKQTHAPADKAST